MLAKHTLSVMCVALAMSFGGMAAATAQTAATPAAPAAKTAPAAKMAPAAKAPKAERSAKSKECSAQADAKGLHGKERKAFRSKCKAGSAS